MSVEKITAVTESVVARKRILDFRIEKVALGFPEMGLEGIA